MSVVIKPPNREQNVSFLNKMDDVGLAVNPGDVITTDSDFMRGHGTYQIYGLRILYSKKIQTRKKFDKNVPKKKLKKPKIKKRV